MHRRMDNCRVLLSPPPLASLLEAGPVALFLDFDGTLVEIASGPDEIEVASSLGLGLESLNKRTGDRVALVTGRSIANLRSFLGPLKVHLAGSHGGHVVEPGGIALREADPLPALVHKEIKSFANEQGLLYERKAHGAALHYRARPELAEHAHEFAIELAKANDLEFKNGKFVIEIVRPGTNKGAAVDLLCDRPPFARALPIFIGDDVTDEDGFASCNRLGGFGILVGDRAETAAKYRLRNVVEVHEWLEL